MNQGRPYPLGATSTSSGTNFCIFSSHARSVQLLLFDSEDATLASRVIDLDDKVNHTGDYWHIELPGVATGQLYGYRISGSNDSRAGLRFNPQKVLIDPYGKAVSDKLYRRVDAVGDACNESSSMRSVVIDTSGYDWEGDQPLARSFRDTVIYELHVAGFTRHPNAGLDPELRGTYAGLVEKIPYLQELGISAVELMPVFHFDRSDVPDGLENYWGYSPVSFFAPHSGYSSASTPSGCLNEFRDMVKSLHRADIEVILDVVYNHTAEGGSNGPTLSLKGIDNPLYYILSGDGPDYADYTGTGNTLNVNEAVVRRMIVDSLRYWVSEMHVDGFRFDLASVLTRNESGQPIPKAPIVWDIDSDPVLASTKLIAEAWDAGGLYQVGSFSQGRWKEWNGRFRDDVRGFIKSDRGSVWNLRQRLLGSPDIYTDHNHPPEQSINFVTCHDGFTLNDLVSFNEKHNEANREDNRDGAWDNRSWNCGEEGETEAASINSLRDRQIRNAYALNLLSIGTPLILMGDEAKRTQQGNNNAYCQNNEMSWFDWSLPKTNAGLVRFASLLIHMRRYFASTPRDEALSLREFLEQAQFEWHGTKLHHPDFSDDSHAVAVTGYSKDGQACHFLLNSYWEPLEFEIPAAPMGACWYRIVDTSRISPDDFLNKLSDPVLQPCYCMQPRSVAFLVATEKQRWTHRQHSESQTFSATSSKENS